jgi:hypothetical protein
MGPKVNAKAQAGRARKEETANKKTAAEEAAREAALAKEWNQGANMKRESRLGEAGNNPRKIVSMLKILNF